MINQIQKRNYPYERLLFQAFLALLFGVCIGGVLNFIAILAKEAHITNAGSFFLICTLCIFVSRLVTGRIFDKKGPAWVILFANQQASFPLMGIVNGIANNTTSAISITEVFMPIISLAAPYNHGENAPEAIVAV